jgi:endoglucanase
VTPGAFLEIAESVLAQPTAPFHEDAVAAEVLRQLAQCPHVHVSQDAFGNIIARYQHGAAPAQFAFVAHMDHPGFVGDRFVGGVPESYRAKKPPVRNFGAFSMWDLPAFDLRSDRIFSRACDDLIGCATILTMFRELEQRSVEGTVYGVFTRAEEAGFIGAMHIARSPDLPRELTIVSLETSSEKGGLATMGEGVIIRVGDRTAIFDNTTSALLADLARECELPFQRRLMSGGTCEATAFQLYGWRTAGLCVALGNYHNCGPDTTIAAEFISVDDALGMTELCVALAQLREPPAASQEILRRRLEREWEQHRPFFRSLALPP